MTKHFPGGGPQADGEDPHFPYGKDQVYPGGRFDDHLRPFESAFAAGTAQVMPYYGRPVGTELEPVGFGFNREVITGLLRGRYGFDGVVCTDWAPRHRPADARRLGLGGEGLGRRGARRRRAALPDHRGGLRPARRRARCPSSSSQLVEAGRISEARIDESARRILRDKFRLGLFDDPYVDPDGGRADLRPCRLQGGRRRSAAPSDGADRERRPAAPRARRADLRRRPPRGSRGGLRRGRRAPGRRRRRDRLPQRAVRASQGTFIESLFHAGSLEFPPDERDRVLEIARAVPTILVVHLDRPAILTGARRRVRRRRRHLRREPRGDPRPRLRRASRRAASFRSSSPRRWKRCAVSFRTCPATPSSRCSRSGTASRTTLPDR